MSTGGAEVSATLRCESSACPHSAHMSKVGAKGEDARAQELRQCAGACGFYFHKNCIVQVCPPLPSSHVHVTKIRADTCTMVIVGQVMAPW
jgi:hypothetical protein